MTKDEDIFINFIPENILHAKLVVGIMQKNTFIFPKDFCFLGGNN